MAKRRGGMAGTVIKISMPTRLSEDKHRKELVEDLARILKGHGASRLSQYTPIIRIECGRHHKIVDLG